MPKEQLNLKGFTFQELFSAEALARLDVIFLDYLQSTDQLLHDQLLAYRTEKLFTPVQISFMLIEVGKLLEAFIAELFNIEDAVGGLQARTLSHDPVFAFKTFFVLRKARRALKTAGELPEFSVLNEWLNTQLHAHRIDISDRELAVARLGQCFLEDEQANHTSIEKLTNWCVLAMMSESGKESVKGWVSFHLPAALNYENLVPIEKMMNDPFARLQAKPDNFRQRDGFKLTDQRMSERQSLDEIHYCVYCHKNDGDFCSKGFPVKKTKPDLGLKINPVGETLTGCPLEEKISEMQFLKKEGYGLASLAMIMADNPMCPATGHRICNDCMKGCIYQKQEPVNIPQTETRSLTDILSLPWGVEIYDLLTRWNPLRQTQWVQKEYNGLKVLVMGMGPAGFTMAHHLLMEGFAVVGADGLKIEPLPQHLIDEPIYQYSDLHEELDDRIMAGFGGVAEYGITVRWDKNFLKLIYISLMRRRHFQVFGSIRFGGTVAIEDTWKLGFDHLVVAVGAGLPRELNIANSLAPGMRQANDFLMALQLTGAAKKSSLANLQVRLPAVVIGGGLTGVDTATEVQAYYIAQVEKIFSRYEKMVAYFGEQKIRERFTQAELDILDEFLVHAVEVKGERMQAERDKREPDFIPLLRRWGGVTIAYRRTLQESPAYKRNHEELTKALEEGIYYAEGLTPTKVILDELGAAKALQCEWRIMDEEGNWMVTDERQELPARAIFVATGARLNVAYAFEYKDDIKRKGFEYIRHELVDDKLVEVSKQGHVKIDDFGVFTSYQKDHRRVSFIGDTHPIFHGSVVKAIASAKRSYPKIVDALNHKYQRGDDNEYAHFHQRMEDMFRARVVAVTRLADEVVELRVRAPMAAANFHPGQFYRVQNYESTAATIEGTRLQTEALAMVGIRDQMHPDELTFLVYENGVSSRLVATLKPGSRISMMGPGGMKIEIPDGGETLLFVGGKMAIAYLLSMAPALRAAGNRVFYVGSFDNKDDVFYQMQLEAITDGILWVTQNGEPVSARLQDHALTGELLMAMREAAMSEKLPLNEVTRVHVIGSSNLLRSMRQAQNGLLKTLLNDNVRWFASVHGPMQCMLKGVCAQCLQWQIDPHTGERIKAVYSCSWQNQPLEMIDIANIDERLGQNRVQEIFTDLWLDYLFEHHPA